MRTVSRVVFVAAVLLQWAVPFASILGRERVLRDGEVIRLPCRAPDPYDPLRGRYLAVSPLENKVPAGDAPGLVPKQRAYAVLEKKEDGLHHLQRLSAEAPASGESYMEVRIGSLWRGDGELRIVWPVSRFYLNEKAAPAADEWLREHMRGKNAVNCELRVWKGSAVITDFSVDGKSFRESLKETGK
jgi:hypothetical protein